MASSPERSREVAAEWGVEQAYANLDEVVASDVDIVHICTPNASHVPYAVALMEAGKHVLCEKPLGDRPGGRRAGRTPWPSETGLVNTIPFAYRFHPMAREMRARVQDEASSARSTCCTASYLQDWLLNPRSTSWRVDPKAGGPSRAFGDIGSHWCDLAEWVTGDRITSLVATTSITHQAAAGRHRGEPSAPVECDAPLIDVETEDSALIMFRTARDVAGSAVISQLSAGRKNRLWLEVDGMAGQRGLRPGAPRAAVDRRRVPGRSVLVRDPNHGSPEQRRLAHAAGRPRRRATPSASRATWPTRTPRWTPTTGEGERPEGLPTFADGLRAAQICDAMLRSAASKEWVDVP